MKLKVIYLSLFQTEPGTRPGPPQRINVPKLAANSTPHDPSGTAGTAYYLQAINATQVRVINKSTGETSKEIRLKDPANGLYNVILKDGSFEKTRILVVKQ